MKLNAVGRNALMSVRNHPWWAAAVAVPVVAASVITSTTMASARPEPMLAVPVSALKAAPAAHVLNFASDPGGKKVLIKGHSAAVKEPWNVDGCDHDYGSPNQCVPWAIPGTTPQARCTWLAANGFGPLQVIGTNRQHLVENAAGYVCAASA